MNLTPPRTWKILAWIELIVGLAPSLLIGSLLLYATFSTDGLLRQIINEPDSPLLIAGIIALIMAIIGILAFKYLRRGENKGIWLSIIPKITMMIILIPILLTEYAFNGSIGPILSAVYIVSIGLIIFAIYCKNQK